MGTLFLKVLNLSVSASFLIVAVILIRMLLQKSPKWIRYILWAMVAVRLIVPFSFESRFSLLPNAQSYDSTNITSDTYIPEVDTTYVVNTASHTFNVINVITAVWITGIVVMLTYMLISFIRVHRMVRESIKYEDNIYLCDYVVSPFVLGIIRPKIYLNSSMSKSESKYIIMHEQAHIRHRDNIWKPFGFVLLSVYWFNPIIWVAYFTFVKDIELFCDESVVKNLGLKRKKKYSQVLLSCSSEKNAISACPLAFAENDVIKRVKGVLSYKKPGLYVVVGSVIMCIVVMLAFMTNPVSAKDNEAVTVAPTEAQTEAPTDPQTEPPTEKTTEAPTDPPVEEYYEDSYYDDSYYDDSYYDDSYYDDSYYSEPVMQPFELSQNSTDIDLSSSYATNGSNYHYPFEKNTGSDNDVIYIFEQPYTNVGSAFSSSSGVQRADSWITGLK